MFELSFRRTGSYVYLLHGIFLEPVHSNEETRKQKIRHRTRPRRGSYEGPGTQKQNPRRYKTVTRVTKKVWKITVTKLIKEEDPFRQK